jgi:uncharacterized protein
LNRSGSVQIPLQEGLFTWPAEQPQLLASQCASCITTTFPRQDSCPACGRLGALDQVLPATGTLWSWTVQAFAPKSPPYLGCGDGEVFRPYGVGYVEFGGLVRVEGRLTVDDPSRLHIGMRMVVTAVPLAKDSQGRELMIYAFAPASE